MDPHIRITNFPDDNYVLTDEDKSFVKGINKFYKMSKLKSILKIIGYILIGFCVGIFMMLLTSCSSEKELTYWKVTIVKKQYITNRDTYTEFIDNMECVLNMALDPYQSERAKVTVDDDNIYYIYPVKYRELSNFDFIKP